MDMKIATAALAALLLAGPSRAAEAKPAPAPTTRESIMTFFKHLQESLSKSAVQGERKKGGVTSVAAVRGKQQGSDDPNEPALKGDARAKKDKQAMAEDAEFAKAVDLVVAGKNEEGIKALEAFKTGHPKSHSLDAVQQAIDAAKGLGAQKLADAASPAAADPKADASSK